MTMAVSPCFTIFHHWSTKQAMKAMGNGLNGWKLCVLISVDCGCTCHVPGTVGEASSSSWALRILRAKEESMLATRVMLVMCFIMYWWCQSKAIQIHQISLRPLIRDLHYSIHGIPREIETSEVTSAILALFYPSTPFRHQDTSSS